MNRLARALLCVALVFLAACSSPDESLEISRAEFSFDGGPWRELPVREAWREPAPRRTTRVRVHLPEDLGAESPALRIETWVVCGDLVAASQEGRALSLSPGGLPLVPLRPHGGDVELTFAGTRSHRLQALYVGDWDSQVRVSLSEIDELLVGAGLFYAGVLTVLVALTLRVRTRASGTPIPLATLGLFSSSVGVMVAAQATGVRGVITTSAETWRWAHGFAPFLFPVGFVGFIDSLFPRSSPWLRRIGLGYLGALGAALALDRVGIASLESLKRLAFAGVLLVIGVVAHRLVGFARTSAPARTVLVGLGLLFVLALPDWFAGTIGNARGWLTQLPNTTHWALLTFVTALGLAAGQTWLAQARALISSEAALAERTTNLENVNVELSRQVAERARAMGRAALLSATIEQKAVEPGDVLDARYRLVRLLGEGGMGSVFEAERLGDQARVALKLLRAGTSPKDSVRLLREAELAATVRHRHVVPVVDVGVTERGRVFVVMQLVASGSLEELRPRFGDWRWGVKQLRQVAVGVAALHEAGIIHRDLKPSNVLVDREADKPILRISDFGIARAGGQPEDPFAETQALDVRNLLETQQIIGTPLYMAPELAAPEHIVDRGDDVFALGVMAYEILSGRYPFGVPPILERLAGRSLPSVDPLPPEISKRLAFVVSRCLSFHPSERPTAAELAHELEQDE